MSWINTKYDFDLPRAVLVVSRRQAADDLMLCKILTMWAKEPEKVCRGLEIYVKTIRPDLAGGFLYGVDNDLSRCQWELAYMHPSFPRVQWHEQAPRLSLFLPEEEPHRKGSVMFESGELRQYVEGDDKKEFVIINPEVWPPDAPGPTTLPKTEWVGDAMTKSLEDTCAKLQIPMRIFKGSKEAPPADTPHIVGSEGLLPPELR